MQQAALRTVSALAITSLYCTGLTMTLEGYAVNSAPPDTPAASAPTAVQPPPASNPSMQKPLTVDESDPSKMGWIQGFPPPSDRIIRFDSAGNMFLRTRYDYSHMREFVPTRVVWRDGGPVSKLPCAERDISGVLLTDPNGTRRTFAEVLKLTYTDGILAMHKDKMIYERYFGTFDAHMQHIAISITKSFVGTLTAMLMMDGKFDPAAPVTQYVPELKDTVYGDATMRQVMDMIVDVRYSEDYAGPNASIWAYVRADGMLPRSVGYKGPDNFYDYLTALRKEDEHGVEFAYKTVNAETLAWIVWRTSNKSLAALLSEHIWQPIGAQDDAYFSVDSIGTESGGGGLNTTLRDLARFDEMIRSGDRLNGKQTLPKSVIDDIRRGGDPAKFTKAGHTTLPGYPYRNMWWVSSNDHHTFETRGIHGQRIYIDPVAQMTIMRYALRPIVASAANDPVTHHAYAALVEYFMQHK